MQRRRALLSMGYSKDIGDEALEYLTMEALEDGFQAKLSINSCQYSIDGKTWVNLPANTYTNSINAGDKLYFKATNLTPIVQNTFGQDAGIGTFTTTKKFNLSGNVMSMLFGDEASDNDSLVGYNHAFNALFANNTNLKNVSEGFLPAKTISLGCYRCMFRNCSNVETAPNIQATQLQQECCHAMFYGCSSLKQCPKIMSTALGYSCCTYMFYGCSSIEETPDLPVMTLTDYCYGSMFRNCTNLKRCSNLPAQTSKYKCYQYMFNGCSNLTYIKAMLTPNSTNTEYWVQGVSSSGTFVARSNTSWSYGIAGIPSGWTIKYE